MNRNIKGGTISAASRRLAITLFVAGTTSVLSLSAGLALPASQQTEPTAPAAVNRYIGAIKAISGTTVTLSPDSGADISISVAPTTRIVRIAPGEKDLKNATPIQLQDLQVGDRILVAAKTSEDGQPLLASSVVVMKHADLEVRDQQNLQDWQKRGVDGPASAVDPAARTLTIAVTGFSGSKKIVIHASNTTVIRRYAPDSVKFEDAKSGTLQDIHPGDQVRARGERSADGSELAAEEIVSGSFPSIAATIISSDASASTLSVHDLLSKKTVVVRITPDSQLRNLPPEMAQRIAMMLKGVAAGGQSGARNPSASADTGQSPPSPPAPGGPAAGGMGMGRRSGGAPDFQRLLTRAPAVSLADLHKGDAVLVLSTTGSTGVGTVITLLSGVDPILRAAPGASSAALLTPWSLSAPSADVGGP